MSINRVTVTGNLVRHALRMTASGTPVLGFTVAVDDRRRNAEGEWEDCAHFVDCTLFGRRAEALEPLLEAGAKIGVDGKLHMSSWEQDGARRTKLEVHADDVELLSPRRAEPA